ncbi:MAG: hypothetical protein WAV00_13070 [Nocardioides sp.]
MVHDIIHDGSLRVAATKPGTHQVLWNVRGGYLLQDWLQRTQRSRLVFAGGGGHAGERRLLDSSPMMMSAAVSPGRTRVAWASGRNELTTPTLVSVAVPATGRIVASRSFRWARVLGVTRSRVLLTRRDASSPATTVWWNFRQHRVTRIAAREAARADLARSRIVIAAGQFDEPAFCNRVAPLSHPHRTLWRSCRWAPHAWSPDGARVVATHTYFDDVGTDRWLTMKADTGRRLGVFTGWDAVWEDDAHVLTLAQGDSGQAAIIRCTVAGQCERASRLQDMGKVTYQPNYISPPVVLAAN